MTSIAAVRRPSRLRVVVRLLANTLFLLGAVAILWGVVVWVWGDPVTAAYTAHQQKALVRHYEEAVRAFPRPAVERDRASERAFVRRAAMNYRADIETGSALGRLRVPELGLNMIFVAGTDTNSLRTGPGWDERTSMPGEGQLVYIAGHRTTYKAPFAHIDRLKRGDPVYITVPYARFVYSVTQSVIVPADDMARLESRGRDEVVLQACHPRFSARQRYLVYARLVSVRPLS